MKLVIVTHTAQKYGAGRSMLTLIDGLSSRGITSSVILPHNGPLAKDLLHRGIEHSFVPFKWWASSRKNALKRFLRSQSHSVMSLLIARKARKWEADVIHTNGSVTPVGAFAARRARIPHIWHIREYGQEDYGLTFDYGFAKSAQIMASLSYRLVIISEALARKYKPVVDPEKIQIVYNPVSLPSTATLEPDRSHANTIPLLVTIGRLHPAKGLEDAILAVAQLLKEGTKIDLKIVGGGDSSYATSLKQLVMKNNADNHISFLGYVDDPGSIIRSAEIVLVCSRSEAFGRVTVEGMLYQKPIIAAKAGASDELIEDNVNGLLYDPGNSAALAEAIRFLLDHPKNAEKMGQNGYLFASKTFTKERHIETMYNLLCSAQSAYIPSQ